jgi:stearoyl-CoA desaturase (delta-9 desaturase)
VSTAFENIYRVAEDATTDAVAGRVCWAPVKSLFLIFCYGMGLAGLAWFTTPGAVAVFTIKTAAVLLLGHSVGMHRRLIHNSFSCPRWLDGDTDRTWRAIYHDIDARYA